MLHGYITDMTQFIRKTPKLLEGQAVYDMMFHRFLGLEVRISKAWLGPLAATMERDILSPSFFSLFYRVSLTGLLPAKPAFPECRPR